MTRGADSATAPESDFELWSDRVRVSDFLNQAVFG